MPVGIERDGNAGPHSIKWKSKYGSVVVSGYEIGTVDGMNERDLVANALYLAKTDYGKPDPKRDPMSITSACGRNTRSTTLRPWLKPCMC